MDRSAASRALHSHGADPVAAEVTALYGGEQLLDAASHAFPESNTQPVTDAEHFANTQPVTDAEHFANTQPVTDAEPDARRSADFEAAQPKPIFDAEPPSGARIHLDPAERSVRRARPLASSRAAAVESGL
jgi:hypothetical protein